MDKKSKALLKAVTLSLLFPYFGGLSLNQVDTKLISVPIHSLLETSGAVVAFLLSAFILAMYSRRLSFGHIHWTTIALISMGMIDFFHAMMVPGELFVWLHSLAVLVGGLVFITVWIPTRTIGKTSYHMIPTLAALTSALACGLSIAFPAIVPRMLIDGQFSAFSIWMNVIGGFGFFIASAKFIQKYWREEKGEDILFTGHSFLFGVSGILFATSSLWDLSWWFWHLLRLASYVIALNHTFNLFKERSEELRHSKKTLEGQNHQLTRLTDHLDTEKTKYKALLDSAADSIHIVDLQGDLIEYSRSFADHLGYSYQETKSLNVKDWEAQTPLEDILPSLHQLARHPATFETKHRRKSGIIRDVQVNAKPITVDGKTCVYASARDISDLKRVENELRESNRELEQFAYAASHDLQAPIRHIAVHTGILKESLGGSLKDSEKESIGYIVSATDQMRSLIMDLLKFSRVGTTKLDITEVGLDELVQQALDVLNPEIEKSKATIDVLDLPILPCDKVSIYQLLMNLLTNALKYQKPGTAPHITIKSKIEGNDCRVSVVDNGIGFDMSHKDRIFEVFKRLHSDDEYEGTGIGLAICRKVALLHGGDVWANSEPGKGSTFVFSLPVARGDDHVPAIH